MDYNSNRFLGFGSYDIYLNVVLPRSPGDFGHEFIEIKYNELLADEARTCTPSLERFKEAYFGTCEWDEISSFCEQSEAEGLKDGSYFANVTGIELRPFNVTAFQSFPRRKLPLHHRL
uniref:Uncharacterized protein n=1 Tax=Leptocylindrus danicus TaxID=163516 RepID=A0A7S2KJ58_9STRA|mmetsp:Transcript_2268/g.3348  ORF Transcript_2268/g.3348 Transcript_2268/m.3348 type:complete len:118 (+) Transcript_2268:334-687(+)